MGTSHRDTQGNPYYPDAPVIAEDRPNETVYAPGAPSRSTAAAADSVRRPAAARPARLRGKAFRPRLIWRTARGPVAAGALALLTMGLTNDAHVVTNLVPLFLVVVVAVAAIDGSVPALISGLILSAAVTDMVALGGRRLAYVSSDLAGVALFVAATLAIALIAGAPRRKVEVLHRALRQQRQRLTEAVRSKSEFMDAAAHELRTPLTVISGYASMIQDETFGRLPDRFRDPVTAMQRKARELNALVDEMLLAARVQKGTAPSATLSLDVRDAVQKAVERAAPRVTLEQATLSYELPSTPVFCDIDPDHLGHILDNLINNALTYSNERPWVKITVTRGDDARILVKDRGWDVPDTMRERIFERFVNYANPDYQPKYGRGLGLSVSRELAERYGGSLELLRTEPNKGSLFVLRLPAAPS